MPCPSPEQLTGLLAEELSDAATKQVETHVQTCVRCQAILAELSSAPLARPPTTPRPDEPTPRDEPRPEFLKQLRQACPRPFSLGDRIDQPVRFRPLGVERAAPLEVDLDFVVRLSRPLGDDANDVLQ